MCLCVWVGRGGGGAAFCVGVLFCRGAPWVWSLHPPPLRCGVLQDQVTAVSTAFITRLMKSLVTIDLPVRYLAVPMLCSADVDK